MTRPASALKSEQQRLWERIAERLQDELPRQSYLTWFKPIQALAFDGHELTLGIPSRFYRDWIESHYQQALYRAIDAVVDDRIQITFEINSNNNDMPNDKLDGSFSAPFKLTIPSNINKNDTYENNLCRHLNFSTFVEGDCNRFARAAAVACAEHPGGTPFNPLMIYGCSGLGKTHLLQAIGNYILDNRTARKVIYITSDQFTAEFVKSIQISKTDAFNRVFRSADVLLLDDVHFFMSKEKTQEEFFHTFNTLHHLGKQLIFSSDRSPRELNGFDARLVSRLQWGLVTEITQPEYETRMAILKSKAERENIILSDDVAHFLAVNITDNIRTLQGVLIHMLAQASLMGRIISIDLAKQVLRNLGTHIEKAITIDHIQRIVADYFKISIDLLRSKNRRKEITEPRLIAMYLSTEYTNLTLKAIGLQFGGRDHATVIHARETINERIKSDLNFRDKLSIIRKKIEIADLL
ncbi:MAG: chromosomal replication initiator protein DnaA [Calditrichaeota bacterium]|nr:chromosomal replication initiator protein DnaA [Calditrichota bacterium]